MLLDRENYALVWLAPPERCFGGYAGTPPGRCPFLLPDGSARPRPRALLCGVLYARAALAVHGATPAWARWAFERFTEQGRKCTLEEAVLELAQRARAEHGPWVSARLLHAGRALCAEWSGAPLPPTRLAAALVLDVWRLLEHAPHLDIESACLTIIECRSDLGGSRLPAPVLESLDYVHCVALHLLGRHPELRLFFWRTAAHRVRSPTLRGRLIRLLEERAADLDALRLADAASSVPALPRAH